MIFFSSVGFETYLKSSFYFSLFKNVGAFCIYAPNKNAPVSEQLRDGYIHRIKELTSFHLKPSIIDCVYSDNWKITTKMSWFSVYTSIWISVRCCAYTKSEPCVVFILEFYVIGRRQIDFWCDLSGKWYCNIVKPSMFVCLLS